MSTAQAWTPGRRPAPPPLQLETVSCLLCGADESQTLIVASDPVTGFGGHFRAVRCTQCDLVYTNPRPTPESIGLFYPADYNPYQPRPPRRGRLADIHHRLEYAVLQADFGYPRSAEARLFRKAGLLPILSALGKWKFRRSRQRQSWFPFRPPGRLLDFGCGAGSFLEEMRRFGWQVTGMDMSPAVARDLTARTGIPVHVGTLPHSDGGPGLQPASFDAVTMWNSLEHVHQPRLTVGAAADLLRSGGLLVVGVPNLDSWGFHAFRHHWHGLELPRHLTHFTPATLCELIRREGFQIHSCDQIGRDGWIRRSARRALADTNPAGRARPWMRALKFKPIALRITRWTERTARADFIRVVAQKR